mgnify:CR=1 FL=1
MTLFMRPSDTQEMRRTSRAVRVAVAVLLLVLLGNAIVATYGLRSSSLAQRQSQIENLSLVLSEHASQTLYSANTALDSIVSLVNAARLQTEPQFRAFAARPEQFELLASKTRANPILDVATLVGAEGKVINFSRSYPPPDIDLSDRDYFRHFLRTRSPNTFFSVPVQNKGTGRWVFYLARSINNEQGDFLGAALVGVSAEVFSEFYARLGASLGPGSTLLLYRNDFTLMTRWPFVATQVGSRNMEGGVSIALDRAAGSGRAVFTSRPRMIDPGVSVERMISARPVAGYPFVVGVVATATLYEWDWIRNSGGIWLATIVSVAILLFGASKLISFQRSAARMRYLADHDALTGLPNRMLFEDRLTHALADARRNKTQCALIFVDLDHFKIINDTYGHAVGDSVLRAVALRLSSCVRDSDTIGRVGGDEFVMLLPDIAGEKGAALVADKARLALADGMVVEGHSISVSCSMGIAIYPQHGRTLSDLTNSADTAMYEAKANGRDTVRVFGKAPPA